MASELYFPGLTPISALQLLVQTLQHRDTASKLLSHIQVCVQAPTFTAFETRASVTLMLTQRDDRASKSDRGAVEQLAKDYRQITMRENPVTVDSADGPYEPLLAALPQLLIASTGEGEPALIDGNIKMIVGAELSDEAAAEALEELKLFAPPVRVASQQVPEGTRYWYYVVNDRSFRAVGSWATGRLAGCSDPLDCYFVERNGVRQNAFMPAGRAPARAALENVVHLLLEARGPLELPEAQNEPVALLVIEGRASDNSQKVQPFVHYPGHLKFIEHFELSPFVRDLANFEICIGDAGLDAQERLQQALTALQPKVGYRLELRSAYRRVADEERYHALRQIQDEATYEMLLIESLGNARPTLLRFTQDQLPALTEVLRAYRVEDTRRLLYAFQADSFRFPAGVHYLLVEPSLALTDLDPLVYWEGASAQPMRFWVDPYWARDYYGGNDRPQVFVPYGAVLYPALHSWRTEDMDAHLHDILLKWQEDGDNGRMPAPRTPIYVFDAEPGHLLDVFVLDAQDFKPLTARLEWLNDCLTVMASLGVEKMKELATVDVKKWIERMAAAEQQRRLTEQFESEAASARARFDATQRQAEKTMVDHSRELLDAITQELAKLTASGQRLCQRAAALNERLTALERDYHEIQQRSAQLEEQKRQVVAGADELNAYTDGLVKRVEGSIVKAASIRSRLEQELAQSITAMSETHEALRARLAELRGLLS